MAERHRLESLRRITRVREAAAALAGEALVVALTEQGAAERRATEARERRDRRLDHWALAASPHTRLCLTRVRAAAAALETAESALAERSAERVVAVQRSDRTRGLRLAADAEAALARDIAARERRRLARKVEEQRLDEAADRVTRGWRP